MALHVLGAVIPANAGIHLGVLHEATWMPAFAGMTALMHDGKRRARPFVAVQSATAHGHALPQSLNRRHSRERGNPF
jgi:hypothetical protein